MRSAEGRGRTLDEAVDAALIQLGESRRNVDVKIVSEGPGETHVEVTVIEQPAAAGDVARHVGSDRGGRQRAGPGRAHRLAGRDAPCPADDDEPAREPPAGP